MPSSELAFIFYRALLHRSRWVVVICAVCGGLQVEVCDGVGIVSQYVPFGCRSGDIGVEGCAIGA